MNANYFLFATLEQARPIAQGRVPEDKTRHTVLTGTPVAGMVYLDRPKPAGYFIFPDLSVRHEGKYRLSFSLYEELKNPKDDDRPVDPNQADGAGDAHVVHRLEVRSQPFIVYSAKKFPGLTESTMLSRLVAEQGCRVRIRRDVRMRRRDTKHGKDEWDDYEDATHAQRRMSGTPDPYGNPYVDSAGRPRSSSGASHQSLVNPLSRRTSVQELNPAYQPWGTAPHTPQATYVQSSPYGVSPGQQFSQPPYMAQQQQQHMQPPPAQYQQYPQAPMLAPQQAYGYYPSASSAAPASQAQYAPAPVQASYEMSAAPRPTMDYATPANDHRRMSMHLQSAQGAAAQQSPYTSQAPAQTYMQQPIAHQPYPQAPSAQQAASYPTQPPPSQQQPQQPPRPFGSAYVSRPAPLEPISAPKMAPPSLPPLNIPHDLSQKLEPSSPAGNLYYPAAPVLGDSHKRSFGKVFNDKHLSQPLRQGARPTTPYGSQASSSHYLAPASGGASLEDSAHQYEVEADNEMNANEFREMNYRRATGKTMTRILPAHSVDPAR